MQTIPWVHVLLDSLGPFSHASSRRTSNKVVPIANTSLLAIVATGRGSDCSGLPAYELASPTMVAGWECGLQLSQTGDAARGNVVEVFAVTCAASTAVPSALLHFALILMWCVLIIWGCAS